MKGQRIIQDLKLGPIPRSELDGEAGKDISINGIAARARRGIATDRARLRGWE